MIAAGQDREMVVEWQPPFALGAQGVQMGTTLLTVRSVQFMKIISKRFYKQADDTATVVLHETKGGSDPWVKII